MQVTSLTEYVKNVVIPVVHAQVNWQPTNGSGNAGELVKKTLNLILIVVVVAAVVFIMFSGLQYVTSQGDAAKAKTAMAGITNAIIGLIITFAAYALVQLVMTQIVGSGVENLPT